MKKMILTAILSCFFFSGIAAQSFSLPRNYMPVGFNFGGGSEGFILGGEASVVFTGDQTGYGFFFDFEKTISGPKKIFFGPEFILGLDYSPIIGIGTEVGMVIDMETSRKGFMTSLFGLIKFPTVPYFRYFRLNGKNSCEAGFLLKCPVPLG